MEELLDLINFETYFNGMNLLIEPKLITSPRGIANNNVNANISRETPNPSNNDFIISFTGIFNKPF